MRSLFRKVFPLILMLVSYAACAQQSGTDPDMVYGPDQLLYNGKLYTFFAPAYTEGNQFIADQYFEDGTITVRGLTFTGLGLNYDLYNQILVLKFKNGDGSTNLLAVSDAWLEAFSLNGSRFERIAIGDTVKHIYQVLGTGTKCILYYRRKEIALQSSYMAWNKAFSAPVKRMYVYDGEHMVAYSNNRNFMAVFDKTMHPAIKKYLRQHRIKVKKAADPAISGLVNYCNSLK